nr:hypothetical protein [uncultured Pseudomonas sp.]
MTENNPKREFITNATILDPDTQPDLQKHLAALELRNARRKEWIGLAVLVFGIALLFAPLSFEAVSWQFTAIGMASSVSQASPGIVVIIAGLLIILFSRYLFQHNPRKPH